MLLTKPWLSKEVTKVVPNGDELALNLELSDNAVQSTCLEIAKNAKQGVGHFYDIFKAGELTEDEAKKKAADLGRIQLLYYSIYGMKCS